MILEKSSIKLPVLSILHSFSNIEKSSYFQGISMIFVEYTSLNSAIIGVQVKTFIQKNSKKR